MSDTKPQFDELRREGRRVYDSRGRLIARCSEQHPPREKTPPYWVQEAYAQLFKAAPKLLAALERLISNRHCFMTSHEDKDTCAQCGENFRHGVHYRVGESAATDIEFARAAIAEAKGEL